MFGINLLLLLFVGLLPFTTSLMVTYMTGPDATVAVLVYGINLLLASLLLSFLLVYIARDRRLAADEVADETLEAVARRQWAGISVEVVALVVTLFAPLLAVGFYFVAAVLFLVLPLVGLHRAGRGAPDDDAAGTRVS